MDRAWIAPPVLARDAAPPARAGADPQRGALVFAAAVLCASLFLQRFAVPFGAKGLSVVGPIGLALAGAGLLGGGLAFHRTRLLCYLALVCACVVGAGYHAAERDGFGAAQSAESLGQFLLLTGFATLTFARPVDEDRFFRMVTLVLAAVAAAGVLQFAAQFVGLGLFSFEGIVPSAILFEKGYNLRIPIAGSLLKSNGFFLVEPSVFSQYMALALAIELVSFRRLPFLGLFAAGFMLSFSGTGWLVLAGFVAAATAGMGARGVVLACATLATLGLAAGATYVFAPELFLSFAGRLDEISQPSTSGHLRFVTPYWTLADVLARDPAAIVFGIGAGVTDRLSLAYEYNINTPVKVLLDYGLPALAAYLLLFVLGRKSPVQGALVLPGLVLFLFTGGYQQFPPVLFPVLLLLSVARLHPSGFSRGRGG